MNKWFLIFMTLLLSVYSVVLNAQVSGQTSLLEIETTPPDSIIVCGDSAFFSVEITNTHSQSLTNLEFNPKMIPGMLYISGSVTGMTEQNIASLNEPIFTLSTINPNQTIVLNFYAKAECSIIDQIINLGGGSSSGGLATNQTRVDYLNNGTSEFALEFKLSRATLLLILIFLLDTSRVLVDNAREKVDTCKRTVSYMVDSSCLFDAQESISFTARLRALSTHSKKDFKLQCLLLVDFRVFLL